MSDLIASGKRKARKDRKCSCCNKSILKDTFYHYQTIKGEDEIYTWGTHTQSGHCGTEVHNSDGYGTFCNLCDQFY